MKSQHHFNMFWIFSVTVFIFCFCNECGNAQILTPNAAVDVQEALREQRILERIRNEIVRLAEKAKVESFRSLKESYSRQMYSIAETVSNLSLGFTNLSEKIETIQEKLDNGNATVEMYCPNSMWLSYREQCYLLSSSMLNWQQARDYCARMNAHLATIVTTGANEFLKRQASRKGGTYWIGGSDINTEGHWIWTNSKSNILYTDWGDQQPNDYGNQDCLELLEKFQWKWNDRECYTSQYFICQADVAYTIITT